jgi:hypothetical protein
VVDETLSRSWARRLVLSVAVFWGFCCLGVVFFLWNPVAFFLALIPTMAAGFYVFRTALEPCRTETGESAWRLLFVPSVTYRHYPAVQDALSDTFRPRRMGKVLRTTGWKPAAAGGLLVLLLAAYLALLALALINGPRWV